MKVLLMFKLLTPAAPVTARQTPPQRSERSRALETAWRNLERGTKLIPARSAFRPERLARLLSHIVLLDIFPPREPYDRMTTRVRLLGSTLRELADTDMIGVDYLDLVPDRDHQTEHLRLCVETPCASWSVAPVVYERGYNSLIEITHFPLTDEETGTHIGMILIDEMGADLPEYRTIGKPIEMKPAIAKAFIDIGAGVPE
jgi:hypothetical protein